MKATRSCIVITVLVLVFYFSAFIVAKATSEPPPLAMLRNTADRVIDELNRNRGRLKGNDRLIYSIVRRILLPRCDLEYMSRSVVGRNYWFKASPSLRRYFIDEFTFYVVRTYSAPLSSYSGEKVKFYPIRNFRSSIKRLQVDSDILQERAPPVRVSYRVMQKRGEWMIYNLIIEGVGLVQNYRSQFSATLRRGGLSRLVDEIRAKNREAR